MNSRWLYMQIHGTIPKRKGPRRSTGRGPARSSRFKAWIRTLECACCGSTDSVEAAHTGSDGGMALKASDYSCIPLCTDCHTQAPHSHHRDRAQCEALILDRQRLTVEQLVKSLNREWQLGREEAC